MLAYSVYSASKELRESSSWLTPAPLFSRSQKKKKNAVEILNNVPCVPCVFQSSKTWTQCETVPEGEEERERTGGPDAIPLQESGPKQENFITLLTLHCQSGTCLGAAARRGASTSRGHGPPEDLTPSARGHISCYTPPTAPNVQYIGCHSVAISQETFSL